mgnify:CR=1 FL=1
MQKSVMLLCLFFLGTYAPSFFPPFPLPLCLQAPMQGGDWLLCNLCVIVVAYDTLLG